MRPNEKKKKNTRLTVQMEVEESKFLTKSLAEMVQFFIENA